MFGFAAVTQVFALRNGLGCGLTICVLFCRSYTSIKTFTLRRKMVMGGAAEKCSWPRGSCSKGQWLEPELSGAGTQYPPGPTHWEPCEPDDRLQNLPPSRRGRPHSPHTLERSRSSTPPLASRQEARPGTSRVASAWQAHGRASPSLVHSEMHSASRY